MRAVSVAPRDFAVTARMAEFLIAHRRHEQALELLHNALADAPEDALRASLSRVTWLAVELASSGFGREVLTAVEQVGAAPYLEPLIVALKKHLGEQTRAPLEIEEVASDIVKDIEAAKKGRPSPLDDENPGA